MVATEPKVIHSTFVVERSFPASPERLFAALATPEQVRQWWAEGEKHDLLEFTMDFTEGGTQRLVYRMHSDTPIAGMTIANDARFQEIIPNNRIVMVATMKLEEKRILASQITFELLPSDDGTDLLVTYQGAYFDGFGANGPQLIEQGWNALLDKLGAVLGER